MRACLDGLIRGSICGTCFEGLQRYKTYVKSHIHARNSVLGFYLNIKYCFRSWLGNITKDSTHNAVLSILSFTSLLPSIVAAPNCFFRSLCVLPSSTSKSALLSCQDLMSRIRDKKGIFPDMRPVYDTIEPEINQHYPAAKEFADTLLTETWEDCEPKKLKKLITRNFVMLTSHQFCDAPLEEIKAITRVSEHSLPLLCA